MLARLIGGLSLTTVLASNVFMAPLEVLADDEPSDVSAPNAQAAPPGNGPQDVSFSNGDLALHGYLQAPPGPGPFPAVLYNHGSEPDSRGYVPNLARVFVSQGYVFWAPFRRGQSGSAGPYIQDLLQQAKSGRDKLLVEQHELQVGDQLAGLNYLLSLPNLDTGNVFVYGWSYGGIQTILGVEGNPGYKAAVACSAAAQSWVANPALRTRLVAAVAKIQVPLFLMQAQNDYSLEPNKTLAAEFDRQGKPYQMRTYPPFGSGAVGAEGHSFCGPRGASGWRDDVLSFFRSGGATLAS